MNSKKANEDPRRKLPFLMGSGSFSSFYYAVFTELTNSLSVAVGFFIRFLRKVPPDADCHTIEYRHSAACRSSLDDYTHKRYDIVKAMVQVKRGIYERKYQL